MPITPKTGSLFHAETHFSAEKDAIKRDEIASRQIHILRQYQGKNERPIKLHQVKQMFEEMKDEESASRENSLARAHSARLRDRADSKLERTDRNGHLPIRRLFYLEIHLFLSCRIVNRRRQQSAASDYPPVLA
jgi:hypothetical protein